MRTPAPRARLLPRAHAPARAHPPARARPPARAHLPAASSVWVNSSAQAPRAFRGADAGSGPRCPPAQKQSGFWLFHAPRSPLPIGQSRSHDPVPRESLGRKDTPTASPGSAVGVTLVSRYGDEDQPGTRCVAVRGVCDLGLPFQHGAALPLARLWQSRVELAAGAFKVRISWSFQGPGTNTLLASLSLLITAAQLPWESSRIVGGGGRVILQIGELRTKKNGF